MSQEQQQMSGKQKKRADTWMPFYVGDYLADTMMLTTIQHGAYILMMLACWKGGGSLPDDDEALASVAKMGAPEWRKHAKMLRAFFTERDGRLWHKRISAEFERAQSLSAARSDAGKKGGRPPKSREEETNSFPLGLAKPKQNETPSQSQLSSSLRSEDEDQDQGREQGTSTTVRAPDSFDDLLDDSGSHDAGDPGGFFHDPMKPPAGYDEPLSVSPTAAGRICKAMRLAGFSQVNPGDLRLTTLIALGATEEEFVGVATEAVEKSKGWGWLLAAVDGRRRDAAQLAKGSPRGPMPKAASRRDRQLATAGALIKAGVPARHVHFDHELEADHVRSIAS